MNLDVLDVPEISLTEQNELIRIMQPTPVSSLFSLGFIWHDRRVILQLI